MLKHSFTHPKITFALPAAFRRLCVETSRKFTRNGGGTPAAFRRLCVETENPCRAQGAIYQPPSGGCVLKHVGARQTNAPEPDQPPSGGCVLKLRRLKIRQSRNKPAAFRRLCVETVEIGRKYVISVPAAFRRLCVETISVIKSSVKRAQPPSGGCVLKLYLIPIAIAMLGQPPSGGCVLKQPFTDDFSLKFPSRLQAAVC